MAPPAPERPRAVGPDDHDRSEKPDVEGERVEQEPPYDDPHDFAYMIKVKENAPELLRKGLSRAPVDVVFTGDYQPAERKFGVSRKMLEVCHELGFPVVVLERSVLVQRDLGLLQSIHQRARAVVAFSIISTPESAGYSRVRHMERLAAPPEKRFKVMETFAKAGIPTGTVCMPILPGLCDDDTNLQHVVRWTADHGGSFVIVGGLTLSDQQKETAESLVHVRLLGGSLERSVKRRDARTSAAAAS